MTPEQIQQIIDGLNTGGRWAFSLAVRQAYVDAGTWAFFLVASTLAFALCVRAAVRLRDRLRDERYDNWYDPDHWQIWAVIAAGVALFVGIISCIVVLPTVLFNPQWYAIKGLLR